MFPCLQCNQYEQRKHFTAMKTVKYTMYKYLNYAELDYRYSQSNATVPGRPTHQGQR